MPCIGNVPSIVANGSITHSGNLTATTIYTPTAAGLFRLSVYITPTSGSNGGSVSPIWTDVNGQTQNGTLDLNTNGYLATESWTFNADASTNIQLATNSMVGRSYILYYVLEQLA